MTEGMPLPGDGPARIAGVPLPAGQRIYGMGMGQPSLYDEPAYDPARSEAAVAWVTSAPMADAGDAWLALSDAHLETGLVPLLLSGAGNVDEVSGAAFGFYGPEDVGLIATMDPRSVLAGQWDLDEAEYDGEEYLDPDLAQARAPFGAGFPGLAPSQQARLPMAALRAAVIAEQPAFLGLVAASRPADVPAAVGWSVFGSDRPGGPEARSLEIAAVLRSWETRFGARPLRIGDDSILRVLVERPPGTLEAAIAVAAEHFAFADDFGWYSGQSIRGLAAELAGQPVWHFWWD
jgi:hypothetical protein